MSLFPAYASKDIEAVPVFEDSSSGGEPWPVSAAQEKQLLSSDEEAPPAAKRARAEPQPELHFYLDTKKDPANLRVSTLYYPGRPDYHAETAMLGAGAGPGRRRRSARCRYWQHGAPGEHEGAGAELPPARAAALRASLALAPRDEELWLRYIRWEEEWGARGAELAAAEEACAALRSPRLREALHRARERHLTLDQLRAALRDDIAAEKGAGVRIESWTRLVEALGAAGCSAGASAALAREAAEPAAYPRLVYAHGCVLRAAGLWERLVLSVELTAAMSFPPSDAFPPPAEPEEERHREEELLRREEAVCAGGLPRSAVWARVERLRAAAHWRPAGGAQEADPQRAPSAAEEAELLRPVCGARERAALAVALLRLAKVPLPGSERCAAAAGAEPAAGEGALAEALAVLARTARRLPPAHSARPAAPAAARAALAPLLEPPHYFTDSTGYLSWTNALWEACCGWVEGWRRLALVCWRLRWLHALARLAEPAEARRLRLLARSAIKRHAPDAPEAYAHFARLEADAAGDAAARAALHAVRAALRDPAAPPERALFAARVLAELAPGPRARWAVCCAALRRDLPADERLSEPPPQELHEAALQRCVDRCHELERELEEVAERGEEGHEEEGEEEEVCATLLPGAGEWAAARVSLAAPTERARLLARLTGARHLYRGAAGLQYGEQAACALVASAAGTARARASRDLLPLFPRNVFLSLVCGGAPLWTGAAPAEGRAALGAVWPRLLRAPLAADGDPAEACRVARLCARAGAGGGALLATLRLEAEARAPQHRTARALYAALDRHPDHKWVYVRGAAWCGAEAAALCDAVLERGLRLHALMEELPEPDTDRSSCQLESDT